VPDDQACDDFENRRQTGGCRKARVFWEEDMNYFITEKSRLVETALLGVIKTARAGNLSLLEGYPDIKVVIARDADQNNVAVISGGGSGHEPAHAGFVGKGLLTAAVCGEVFASPSVDAVLSAIVAVTGHAGCLLIVKNYTGDRLNFGLAAEKARALGYQVETVVVSDDIALPEASQPRGLAGTLFVHKVAGHLSMLGLPLADVAAGARKAAAQTATLGLAVDTCTLPGSQKTERIKQGQAELGLGIHGEPGAELVDNRPIGELVETVASHLAKTLPAASRIALLINNLGGMTELEMASVADALSATALFESADYLIGPKTLMTSLDMKGFSLSYLVLDAKLEEAITSAVEPLAWQVAVRPSAPDFVPVKTSTLMRTFEPSENQDVRAIVASATALFIDKEAYLNELDGRVGDGDTGSTFATAARTIAGELDRLPFNVGTDLLARLSDILSRNMGGSSGILLAIFFAAASDAYRQVPDWPKALKAGLDKMKSYGGADIGDRTMIDALQPAIDSLLDGSGLKVAASAARLGADMTGKMHSAKAGRSAYVAARNLEGNVDPGAEAVALLFERLASD
jgi:triose/dihydroxyacetone kinase / FAD-AMP lyase (cyclizing)